MATSTSNTASLQARVAELEDALAAHKQAAKRQLSELSLENDELRSQLAKCTCNNSRHSATSGGAGGGAGASSRTPSTATTSPPPPPPSAVVLSNTSSATTASSSAPLIPHTTAVLANAHGKTNALCCAQCPSDTTLLLSGGADSHIVLWRLPKGQRCSDVNVKAPPLAIACHPTRPWVATGCMDGSVVLLHIIAATSKAQDPTLKQLTTASLHTKFVTQVRWSLDGAQLLTGSHDKTLVISTVTVGTKATAATATLHPLRTFTFSGCVEALAVAPTPAAPHSCVVSVRGSHALHYLDCDSDGTGTAVPLVDGMTSAPQFTVVHLERSPDGTHLAAATDGTTHFVYAMRSSTVTARLVGHSATAAATPVLRWSPSGEYLIGSPGPGWQVLVWDVASEDIVLRLPGHSAKVRSVVVGKPPSGGDKRMLVASCSYDKSVRVYELEAA